MMIYSFTEKLCKQGNRYYIKIPFHVWKVCGQKGCIPVEATMDDFTFECRLIPKGEGMYYIPIKKDIAMQLPCDDEIRISFRIIEGLTRIYHDSPYGKNHPIRKIDSIQSVTYPKAGYCGQVCIAMLTGLHIDSIIDIMQAKAWQCSFSKILETLDYFGIPHDHKITYTKRKAFILPDCCIINVKDENISHFHLYYKGQYFGAEEIDVHKIIGYLSIKTD